MGWQDDDSYPQFPEPSPQEKADYAAYVAWQERERAAGREEEMPEPWQIEGPAISISLGDATRLDPALLAALGAHIGRDEAVNAQWAQDKAADALRPGPVLAALTEQATSGAARLTDDELTGALSAARRLENHAAAQQVTLIAELARRRRAQWEDARARNLPKAWRKGMSPDAELAMELTCSINGAADLIDEAIHLTTRLPATFAGMLDGVIDYGRALIIHRRTRFLNDADTAQADAILAQAAPGLRHDQLQRKADALEMKLDPDAARRRRERAAKDGRRVEVRREHSGNAAIAGRELDVADVLAAKAHIDALADELRRTGVPGTLQHLRAGVAIGLLQGRNPLDLAGQADAEDTEDRDDLAGDSTRRGPAAPARLPAPVPVSINLLVPVGNLFGWPAFPALAGGWGLLDAAQTGDLFRAAAAHPATRWCWTLLRDDGTAAAHACAPGRHPWPPPDPLNPNGLTEAANPEDPGGNRDGPTPEQAAQLAAFLAGLGATLRPIAKGSCDHPHAEDRYVPSRQLKHLVQARTATCPAPGCDAQACRADADHTIPWPDGPTDECNLAPPCRRHHRVKQSPDWKLEQPEPGVMVWTTPAGRTYTTTPTVYDT
jgi:Domain of unknown function (DUF222)